MFSSAEALDLHSPPGGAGTSGGYAGSDAELFIDRAAQEMFVDIWRRIARRYRGNPVIWAFDLANDRQTLLREWYKRNDKPN